MSHSTLRKHTDSIDFVPKQRSVDAPASTSTSVFQDQGDSSDSDNENIEPLKTVTKVREKNNKTNITCMFSIEDFLWPQTHKPIERWNEVTRTRCCLQCNEPLNFHDSSPWTPSYVSTTRPKT